MGGKKVTVATSIKVSISDPSDGTVLYLVCGTGHMIYTIKSHKITHTHTYTQMGALKLAKSR